MTTLYHAVLRDLWSEGLSVIYPSWLFLEPRPQFALVGSVHCPTLGRKAKMTGYRMHKTGPWGPVHLLRNILATAHILHNVG